MTPEVLAALRRVVDELGADAGVLMRLTSSGACVVTSSTLVPALGVDDVWGAAGSLSGPDFRPELVLDPDRLAQLVPAGVLRALPFEPTGTLVAPVGDHELRIVLLWRANPPPVDATSTMESEAMQRFTVLTPLLDAQVRARESATRLRAVASALDQAVVVTVAGDVLANVNAAAARLLGLQPGHVDGTTLATAMRALRERAVDPDALGVEVARLRESATAVAHDWVWHLHGSPSHLRVTSAPVDTTTEQGRVWVFDDISAEMELVEREQRANRALEESEERYRLLAENVSDVVMLGTADGTITWVSPSVTPTLGWAPEDLVGHRGIDSVRPENVDGLRAMQGQVMRGEIAEFEAPMRTAVGADRWMHVRAKPVLDDDGRVVGRVVGLWDVQASHEAREELERHEVMANQALAASEERYRLLAENISDVAVLFDLRGVVTWVSPSITTVLGWAPDDLVGRTTRHLVNPDQVELAAAHREPLLRGERVDYEVQMRTAAGDYRWMEVRATPLRDEDGRLSGQLAAWWDSQAAHDATEDLELRERHAAQALVDSEQRYRLLAENVSDVVMMGTLDGVLTWASPSVTATLGWAPEDILGTRVPDFVRPDHLEVLLGSLERVDSGERVTFEVPIRTAGGEYRWMEMRAKRLLDDQERVVGRVAALWDVQAAHEAQEQLEQSERRAARALAQSEQRYRLLAENVSDVVVMGATDGTLTWASPSITVTLGWAPEDMVGRQVPEFVRADHLEVLQRAMEQVERGENATFEAPILTSGGGYRWMEVRGRLLFDDRGRVVGRVAALWDVHESHEAKEQLARSERRYELLLENTTEVVFQTVDEVVTWVSPAVEGVTGWKPADIVGTSSRQLWHPDDWERASWAHDVARDGTHGREVLRLVTPEGAHQWMEVVIRPYVEEDGRPGTVGMIYDVSERELAQEAARQSEERYRTVAENASDVVCRYGFDGTIEWVFGSTEAFLGHSAAELVGSSLEDYFMVEDWGDREVIRARLARGEAVELLARVRRSDSSTRWVELRAKAVPGPDGSPGSIIGTMRDAHAEVEYREALAASERQARDLVDAYEAARDEAVRASTAKTAFLSRMSHELRTPLNAVLGFAQLLALDPLSPEQVEAVHHIRVGGRHLLDLINEIVDISRIEAGRLSLSMETVDSAAVLADAVELVRPLAKQHDVVVETAGARRAVDAVYADRQRTTQVLLNLVSNAVKYNRPGGSVRVQRRSGGPGEVFFEVSDTGPGIPPELLPRLFEPFDRLGAENSDVEGTGIGLALADALARAMGGRIEVSTTVGAGSTFTLVLRAVQSTATHADAAEPEPEAPRDSRLHILYVEDNPTNATLMGRVVALRPGSRLQIAVDGAHGIAAALLEPPDLVFLDLHLPDMSGEEVLQQLRRLPGCAEVPVVVVTADASPNTRERMSALGSDGFLTKPFDLDEVLGWIDATESAVGEP